MTFNGNRKTRKIDPALSTEKSLQHMNLKAAESLTAYKSTDQGDVMKNTKQLALPIILLSMFLLNACHSKLDPFHSDSDGGGGVPSDGMVQSIGIGAADTSITNLAQRLIASRNAAVVASQFEMLQIIKGLHYSDGSTAGDKMAADAALATQVDALISGADIIKTEYAADDSATVTIQLLHSQIRAVVGNVVEL